MLMKSIEAAALKDKIEHLRFRAKSTDRATKGVTASGQ